MFALDRFGRLHDLVHDEVWPASRLATEVRRRVRVLRRLCSGQDDRFVIAHGDTPSFFADLFAVWQAGACAVCVNPRLAAGELANVLDFLDARAVLVDDADVADVRVPSLCTARERVPDYKVETERNALDDDALILFTSGTTGSPKGVLHSHRSIQARVALNVANIGHAALRRSLCVLPTHFGHGLIGNALTPLLAGADLFLWPGVGAAGAHRLSEVIVQHRIGFMSSVPAFWKLVLKASSPPPPGTLQRVHIGSAPLAATLWADVVTWAGTNAVANMYGTTETANWIGGMSAAEMAPEDGLLGRPWGGQVAVRGADGEPAVQGEGEIIVRSPSLMTGYFRRPDLTALGLQDGWYRTGDSGTIDAGGVLRMTGRRRDVINRGGFKIYPEELDLLFERHAAVYEACAFAMPDAAAGEGVAVAVRLRDGAAATPPELAAWARGQIREQARPDRIYIVAELPRTERGKLDRARVAGACLVSGA
jgi:acyl-CoA synthetase (AMP-forming)/AMP-acid ligase II